MGEPRELTADEIRSVLGAHPSRKVLENLVQRYRWLENELKDLEASFDFRWKADMRAIERWKKENPEDRSHKWPDHVNLVLFLMSELEKKECQTQEPQ